MADGMEARREGHQQRPEGVCAPHDRATFLLWDVAAWVRTGKEVHTVCMFDNVATWGGPRRRELQAEGAT
jgi:hypothetical protein